MAEGPNRPVLRVLELLKYGFFFGIGLSAAAWAAYALAYVAWPKQSCVNDNPSLTSDVRAKDRKAARVVEFSDIEERKTGDRLYFIGKVTNNSAVSIDSAQIEVALFQGPKFVDQYITYLPGSLAPGETRHFKVSCDCGSGQRAADHDRYEVKLVGGF